MQFFKRIILLQCFLCLVLSCSGPKKSVDFDPNFPMATLSTFSIAESSGANIDPLNSQRIHEAIQNYLVKKGYTFVNGNKEGDFVAHYNVTVYKDVPSNFSIGIGLGGFSVGGIGGGIGTSVTPTTDKLHIRIDMYDPETKKVFWSASEIKTPSSFDTPEARTEFFTQAIAELLAKFPKRP